MRITCSYHNITLQKWCRICLITTQMFIIHGSTVGCRERGRSPGDRGGRGGAALTLARQCVQLFRLRSCSLSPEHAWPLLGALFMWGGGGTRRIMDSYYRSRLGAARTCDVFFIYVGKSKSTYLFIGINQRFPTLGVTLRLPSLKQLHQIHN